MPGVTSAAAATMSPLTGRDRGVEIAIKGESLLTRSERGIHINHVTPGYFNTMGVPLLVGRDFDARDSGMDTNVVIVNRKFAEHFFGSVDRSRPQVIMTDSTTPMQSLRRP